MKGAPGPSASTTLPADVFASLGHIYTTFRRLGIQSPNLRKAFDDIRRIRLELDGTNAFRHDFVERFAPLGWVLHDTLPPQVLKAALDTARTQTLPEAEELLAASLQPADIEALIARLASLHAFQERTELAASARRLYADGLYQPCILLLLTLIDGFTSDLSPTGRGLFADSTDLFVEDALAGYESGLPALRRLLCATIDRTTSEPTTIPYRHGIVHGKILNYDNRINAAKLWGTLFAIRDWQFRKKKPAPEKKTKDAQSQAFREFHKWQKLRKELDSWQPRLLTGNEALPVSPADNLPEAAVARFLAFWKQEDYPEAGKLLVNLADESEARLAGRARQRLGGVPLLDYALVEIADLNILNSHVVARCTYTKDGVPQTRTVRFELLYVDGKEVTFRVSPGGKWAIMERSVSDL